MTGIITERLEQILSSLPPRVRLVAVSKQVPPMAIREAYEAGIRDFAENKVSEAIAKQQELLDLADITWHFIGHVQTNKAKKVLQHFSWVHSVDSLRLTMILDRLSSELSVSPKVFLQVKMLSDPNKYGWEPKELLDNLGELNLCKQIKIKGLMTILPLGLSLLQKKEAFEATRKLQEQINEQNLENLHLEELSMGMSGDYLEAISSGATIIRLGQIIFCKNNT